MRRIEYRHVLRPSVTYLEQCGRLLLTSREMAEFLGLKHAVLQQLVSTDRILLPVRLGLGKTYRWSVLEVLEWVAAGCPRRGEWIAARGRSGWYPEWGWHFG